MFRPLLVSVWAYVVAYSLVYFAIGAKFTAWFLMIGAVVLCPIQWALWRTGHEVSSRVSFFIACLAYVYSAGVGLPSGIFAEAYYLVAMMVPSLLFPNQAASYRWIWRGGMALPVVAWIFHRWSPFPPLPVEWRAPANFPTETFAFINLVGASTLFGIFHSIFVRKSESSLKRSIESRNRLEEAQRVARIGSWSFDVTTKKISWSVQMFKLFNENIDHGEPSYERHRMTIHEDDRAYWDSMVNQCLTEKLPYVMRFRSVFPDKVIWIEAHGNATVDDIGRVVELSGTCQDISERIASEEALKRERAKAIQASKLASLGEMSAGIAHEINNPLSIVAGAATLITRQAENPQAVRKSTASIEKAVTRISRIVTSLRKFSRTAASEKKELRDLRDIVREAETLTQAKSKRHSVVVQVTIPNEPVMVLGDEIELGQVFINLLNNAIDASTEVTGARGVELKLERSETHGCVRVFNSGKKISNEVQGRLFTPFFTTKPVGEGTGLGLSIVKGIIEEHGGRVRLATEHERTCFEVTLPLREAKSATAA